VEPVNPFACYYASVTRKTLAGTPEEGYEAEQKMTRMQALRSYTLDAAYGAFEDQKKGSIEPGKYADFAVLSHDIITCPEREILQTEALMTFVGGKLKYQKQEVTAIK
ncbi:MAG: amidohydrolase family protein, partial [Bacteroidota bacterium]